MDILCYDISCHIFEYVEIDDTLNVLLISKQFDYIANDNLLWKCYYNRDYRVKHVNLNILSKKEAYKKCHEICILKHKLKMGQSIFDTMNLQELYLQCSNVMIIPKEIKYLVNLQTLHLSDNKIMKIPKEIKYLVNLQMLHLSDNKIMKIPKEIKYLVNLLMLHLSDNTIMKIPKEIKYLVNLQKLLFLGKQNKRVTERNKIFSEFTNLWLSDNQIKEIFYMKESPILDYTKEIKGGFME